MTVGDLLGRMSSPEFAEWIALAELEAEEGKRADLSQKASQGLKARRRR